MNVKLIIKEFKAILKEASKTFGVPPHAVNNVQFGYVSAGRVSKDKLSLLGGYGKLKAYVAPNPKGKDKAAAQAMQTLLQTLNGKK